MNMNQKIITLACVALAVSTLAGAPKSDETWSVTLRGENDIFGGSDRWYTNGGSLHIGSPTLDVASGDLLESLLEFTPANRDADDLQVRASLQLAQNLYTPEDISQPDPDKADRPYAAWLRLVAGLRTIEANRMDVMEFSGGTTGTPALGEFAQVIAHRVSDSTRPEGWDAQIKAEPIFQLSWIRYGRFREDLDGGLALDFIPLGGGTLGNGFIWAIGGADLRFGYNLPYDFGHSRLIASGRYGETFAVPEAIEAKRGNFGVYLLLGADAQWVIHDITLDGSLFHDDDPTVARKPFVANFATGLALHYDRFRLTYRQMYRSPEFDNQNEWQIFGSASIDVRF